MEAPSKPEAGGVEAYREAEAAVRDFKRGVDPFNGVDVVDGGYRTGRLKILRRSLTDVLEHCDPHDANLLGWLAHFTPDDMKGWTYEGWAENRPIEPG